MDLFRRHVTLLSLALMGLLAGGCDVEEASDAASEVLFTEPVPAPSIDVELPGGSLGVAIDAPGSALTGDLLTLSREDAWDLLWSDPALRGHLKGYRDRADQLRHAVNTVWARYPGRAVGLFWGDAAKAAWPLEETVGLRTTLHVHTAGFGPAALPLRFQAPGLSQTQETADGLIFGVIVAQSAPPTLGLVDAAIWNPVEGDDRRLPSWSWGGLQRLTDDATGLDLVLCDIGLAPMARERIRWTGAAMEMDDHLTFLDAAPLERDADARASWKYSLQEGILRAWQRGDLTWETPVAGAILAGLDADAESLVVVGETSVEVVDATTGVLVARFVRGWGDVPGLSEALAGLNPDRRDRDPQAALPLGAILAASWAHEADAAAARGWGPVAAWWDGWAEYFSGLPY